MADKKKETEIQSVTGDKKLDETIADIEKAYGKGSIMKLGDRANSDISAIPSGSVLLDAALGVGGYPRGRIIEIYGPESSGKTTLALHAIAETQKAGGRAAFIDAENAIDPEYAKNLGVDIDNLLLSQPDNGEQALEICEMLAKSEAIDLIVVDSVAALVPKAELEAQMLEQQMGLQARMMSKALRKIAGILNKSETTVIFINQLRETMSAGGYGPKETTTGGRALRFYASIRIDVRRTKSIKDSSDDFVSNMTQAKVVKNKVAPPFKTVFFQIVFGKGISHIDEIVDCAIGYKMIKKSGSWFSYGDEKLGQGKPAAVRYVESNPDVLELLEKEIKEKLSKGEYPEFEKN